MTHLSLRLTGLVLLAVAVAPLAPAADTVTLLGRLAVVWGDPQPTSGEPGQRSFVLHGDDGVSTRIVVPDELLAMLGGVLRVDRRRVEVVAEVTDRPTPLARFIRLLDPAPPSRDVTGSRPWVSIMCKFADVSSEPASLAYFQDMFDTTAPRLDHYWRELSSGTIDVVGSTAAGWFTLPNNRSSYLPGGSLDHGQAFDDCTGVADPYVDFSNGGTGGFDGINLMFNDELDGYAWGGGWPGNLDGVDKYWRTTWEPPWGWGNVGVMCHEMGHGFGLPHANNADGDSDPYDNPWDVMSDSWGWAGWDATYGTVGKHTNAYHKDLLGWIPSGQRLDVTTDGVHTITIDQTALASTSNFRMVRITIPGSSRFYTVEVRDLVDPYDGNLPGNAVIIHEVDEGRNEPAWLVDEFNPSNGADEGAMWRVGECFQDQAAEITVCVDAATPDGFEVTIGRGFDPTLIFADGFEDGDLLGWSDSTGF
jgi:M6 family metalloprotease-like protein